MRYNSILQRMGDKKRFTVGVVGHWCYIESEDGTEDDRVKWYGDEGGYPAYVGATSGHAYLIVQDEKDHS